MDSQQKYIFGLLIAFLLLLTVNTFAQQTEQKTTRIKIMKEQDGKMVEVDTTLTISNDEEIEQLLKKMGIKDLDLPPVDNGDTHIDIQTDEDGKKVVKKKIIIKQEIDGKEGEDKPFLGVILVEKKKKVNGEEVENVRDESKKGVKIQDVVPESAAAQAGLKSGDIITAIDGKTIETEDNLVSYMEAKKVGEEINITFLRNEKTKTEKAVLTAYKGMELEDVNILEWYEKGEGADDENLEQIIIKKKKTKDNGISLGIWVEEKEGQTGITVANVFEGSAADKAGVKEGDVITKLGEISINSLEEMKVVLGEKKDGDELAITYERAGKVAIGKTTLKADLPKEEDEGETKIFKWGGVDMGKFNKELKGIGKDLSKILENIGKNLNEKEQHIIIKDKDGTIIEKQLEKGVDEIIIEGDGDKLNITEVETVVDENGQQKRLKIKVLVEDVAKEDLKLLETKTVPKSTNSDLKVDRLSFFPNPSKGVFELSFTLPENGAMTVRVVDVTGKEVFRETKPSFSGQYTKQLDIANNTKGIYFVQITQNSKVLNKKILVQ